MEIIIYCKAFIIGIFFTLIIFFTGAVLKDKKPINKVHFYVARNKSFDLYLFIGKPVRYEDYWGYSKRIAFQNEFNRLNLNVEDFKDLKWEDEPIEVFLNMKD